MAAPPGVNDAVIPPLTLEVLRWYVVSHYGGECNIHGIIQSHGMVWCGLCGTVCMVCGGMSLLSSPPPPCSARAVRLYWGLCPLITRYHPAPGGGGGGGGTGEGGGGGNRE